MTTSSGNSQPQYDVIVVGAGFAGLYALHTLREKGFRVKVFEAAGGVGGTWYWNRYPGARCDIQSLVYCFTFDQQLYREWIWSERYATQPEILKYLNFVADRLDLRRDIRLATTISKAAFVDDAHCWNITTAEGETVSARYLLMATGSLSVNRMPGVNGLETFKGEHYHTGRWPHSNLNFAGKRVGIIGTGSSGVQVIPLLAREAEHLTVFQRTAPFVVPARNAPICAADTEHLHQNLNAYRSALRTGAISGVGDVASHLPSSREKPKLRDMTPQAVETLLRSGWETGGLAINILFSDLLVDSDSNAIVAEFLRARIREIVRDGHMAEQLTPRGYPYLSKRVSVGTDYYETFNRDNVTLVDVESSPIEAFTDRGLRTTEREYSLEAIILATGYDALTGALTAIDIRGLNGRSLRELWAYQGPQSYLGLCVAGFPNLFTVNGPGSPGILGNVVVAIEYHVEWIVNLLLYGRAQGYTRVEADAAAEQSWALHVHNEAAKTLLIQGKNWWMKDVEKDGSRIFVPCVSGLGTYHELCDQIAAADYRAFHWSADSPS